MKAAVLIPIIGIVFLLYRALRGEISWFDFYPALFVAIAMYQGILITAVLIGFIEYFKS